MRQKFFLITLLLLFGGVSIASAKLIEPEGLILKILEHNSSITQFYIESRTRSFDPEAYQPLDEEDDQPLAPVEIKEASFVQAIFWVRDEYVGIETLDLTRKPLHTLFRERDYIFTKQLQELRVFSTEDLLFPYDVFFTKFTTKLLDAINGIGIAPLKVKMIQMDNRIVYQLGNEQQSLIVDPDDYRVLAIHRQLQVRGRYYPLTVEFSEWDTKSTRIPRTTQFRIKNRLVKEIRVTNIQRSGVYRYRRAFMKQYRRWIPKHSPFPFELNFAH